MSEFNQSVVMVCDDANKANVNTYFDGLGLGPATMSIELRDGSDGVWWGSHAWWQESMLHQVSGVPVEYGVITSIQQDAVPMQHFMSVLAANDLTMYQPEA